MKVTAAEGDKPAQEKERQELGISKNQYKKLMKQRKWDETKEKYREIKREKRKEKRAEKRQKRRLGEDNEENKTKKFKVNEQIATNTTCVIDCGFDELMSEKEIKSLSNQITRMYSAKRVCPYQIDLVVEPFDKRLRQTFDQRIPQYKLWQNVDFQPSSVLETLTEEEKQQYVYLTADTDEVIETLEENKKYIIGGIVDKNRHKNLCVNKAQKLGLKVGRLPIDKYIEINGRQVLATSHVYEIICKWFEFRDWKKAFDAVLPARKIKVGGNGSKLDEEAEIDATSETGIDAADSTVASSANSAADPSASASADPTTASPSNST